MPNADTRVQTAKSHRLKHLQTRGAAHQHMRIDRKSVQTQQERDKKMKNGFA